MPNPRPKLENLKPFERQGERERGKSISTRYPLDVEAALMKLGDKKLDFIREAVEQVLKERGLM